MSANTVKHTPGEWLFDRSEGWVYTRIAPLTKFVVATMESGTQDEQEANARLIAAAPDLLEALKDAMRSSRKDFKAGPDGDRQHREAYAEQFAAISKAEAR